MYKRQGIDGGFLQEAGISITEMNSGCICCSLVGDFGRALQKVLDEYAPDRIPVSYTHLKRGGPHSKRG